MRVRHGDWALYECSDSTGIARRFRLRLLFTRASENLLVTAQELGGIFCDTSRGLTTGDLFTMSNVQSGPYVHPAMRLVLSAGSLQHFEISQRSPRCNFRNTKQTDMIFGTYLFYLHSYKNIIQACILLLKTLHAFHTKI